MDDIDKKHECLAAHIKHWTDKFGFTAETKGGACAPKIKKFIITSQYQIEEIFNEKDAAAIRRRCKVIHMVNFNV